MKVEIFESSASLSVNCALITFEGETTEEGMPVDWRNMLWGAAQRLTGGTWSPDRRLEPDPYRRERLRRASQLLILFSTQQPEHGTLVVGQEAALVAHGLRLATETPETTDVEKLAVLTRWAADFAILAGQLGYDEEAGQPL